MGAYFGVVSKREILEDVFFGTDYHSHLGTKSGGIAVYDRELGLQRKIHNLGNAPFRAKFEHVFSDMKGTSAIGVISDSDPEPLIIRSRLGLYAVCTVGVIKNSAYLSEKYLNDNGGHFGLTTGLMVNSAELVASLINQKKTFAEGIKFAQDSIEGTACILVLKSDGNIIAARDKLGRLPLTIGRDKDGFCVAFEDFSYRKLGYTDYTSLGAGEIAELSPDKMTVLSPAGEKMRVCSFLWTYYGYPTASYEGRNVEIMRCENGVLLAEADIKAKKHLGIDYIAGVPDSGTPHAIGYANRSGIPFARPYIKYTPTWSRSFMPDVQRDRNEIAKMKQVPVRELIEGKTLLFVDDSIVRGTQLKETVEFLYANGAKAVHMRSACPPIMFGCKYLNFSRATGDMELITRRVINELEGDEGFNHLDEYSDGNTERGKKLRSTICEKFGFASLEFQSLDNLIKAIGIDKCKLCTYCWNGAE
ncbi:MAG: amidophosphoribosyltransferase [Clostridia bacterium]|nr:amidophosphoribosyltransferase [Clostridia bacterium]